MEENYGQFSQADKGINTGMVKIEKCNCWLNYTGKQN